MMNFAGQSTLTHQVSFQWKNPDFLLKHVDFLWKNPDFLLKHVDFLLKNVDFITKTGDPYDHGPVCDDRLRRIYVWKR